MGNHTTLYFSVAAWGRAASLAEPRPTLVSVYIAASTFSHHGVQHANFECSYFTGAASILHDVASDPGNVARSLGDLASNPVDATRISVDATSIPDDATCIPGDIAIIPWVRQIG
ncbi:unnamed protein product [Rotaria magnacalcarata]|uniref:Uncharacterized protein n=1 Tax=Rotaria magnacalcarata TaxID=392030 RepID=A0A819TI45_9BILA|nr:unnamed protein product [Rotaria magnacalcarata]CAF1553494.1 unnamed protein product [Rotaria magnacalcarata]CAF2009930.1 unnamed protein product [Rotaria magnacalcarata]CAF4077588.1 unnamed protein product [Rotaria magnacalcarata]CAF4101190.1 unnamed protein product [Rotaria magnacalcarata]